MIYDKINCRFNKRVPRGGWPKITSAFNNHFKEANSMIDVKNLYTRIKTRRRNPSESGHGDMQPKEVISVVADTQKYRIVKQLLLNNIDRYVQKGELKPRTKKGLQP